MTSRAAGMVNIPVRRLPVWVEMNPAIEGRTDPPKPAVKRIQRESAV